MRRGLFYQLCLCGLILSSCWTPPDFYTPNGMMVWNDANAPVNEYIMGDAENCLVPCLDMDGYNLNNIVHMLYHSELYWVDSLYLGKQPVAGLADYNRAYVVWLGSIRKSAYFHEMLHLAQMQLRGLWDYDHEDPEWKSFGECISRCDLIGD